MPVNVLDNEKFFGLARDVKTEAGFSELIEFLLGSDAIGGNRTALKQALDEAFDHIQDPSGAADIQSDIGIGHIEQCPPPPKADEGE